MTELIVKLVDRASADNQLKEDIRIQVQEILNTAFEKSKNTVRVTWGDPSGSDTAIVNFVSSVEKSYILEKMKGAPLKPFIGGHTRKHGNKVCSEVYKAVKEKDTGEWRTKIRPISYAKLIVHELLHNRWPAMTEAEVAETGGIGKSPSELPLTDWNKGLLTTGLDMTQAQQL